MTILESIHQLTIVNVNRLMSPLLKMLKVTEDFYELELLCMNVKNVQ